MRYVGTILILLTFTACDEEVFIPKPPTYLRLDLPEHNYQLYSDDCPYQFEISDVYKVEKVKEEGDTSCNRRIDLGPLNGMIFFRYWDMSEPLSYYINNANDEVDRHKIKATDIKDQRFVNKDNRVYGTLFELEGDVATPYQFYLTDSTDRFVYCEILFNSTPNYDSLKPSLDYLREDINQMIQSFQWK